MSLLTCRSLLYKGCLFPSSGQFGLNRSTTNSLIKIQKRTFAGEAKGGDKAKKPAAKKAAPKDGKLIFL